MNINVQVSAFNIKAQSSWKLILQEPGEQGIGILLGVLCYTQNMLFLLLYSEYVIPLSSCEYRCVLQQSIFKNSCSNLCWEVHFNHTNFFSLESHF